MESDALRFSLFQRKDLDSLVKCIMLWKFITAFQIRQDILC